MLLVLDVVAILGLVLVCLASAWGWHPAGVRVTSRILAVLFAATGVLLVVSLDPTALRTTLGMADSAVARMMECFGVACGLLVLGAPAARKAEGVTDGSEPFLTARPARRHTDGQRGRAELIQSTRLRAPLCWPGDCTAGARGCVGRQPSPSPPATGRGRRLETGPWRPAAVDLAGPGFAECLGRSLARSPAA
jgi:hypothetical protein